MVRVDRAYRQPTNMQPGTFCYISDYKQWLITESRVYFKRGLQPKCGVQNEKCGLKD